MNKETKLRIHNITAKAALKFASEAWVLKKREEQRLEAAQMKFLRHLLGITKLDKEKNQRIKEKTGAQDIVKEIKRYQEKWLQHVQRWTQTEYKKKHYNISQKDEGTLDDRGRDGGSNFIVRIKEQETSPALLEHDDDYDYDDDDDVIYFMGNKMLFSFLQELLFKKLSLRTSFPLLSCLM